MKFTFKRKSRHFAAYLCKKHNGVFVNHLKTIDSGKWSRLQVKHAFVNSSEMHPEVLELYGNKQKEIVKFIVLPRMTVLRHLNLKNNKISSISKICHLQAPNLEELLLGDNFITNIKEISKMECHRLKVLSLYANRITEVTSLYQAHLPQLRVMILGLNCIAIFSQLNKCQWPSIQKISFECNRRVIGGGNKLPKWSYSSDLLYG